MRKVLKLPSLVWKNGLHKVYTNIKKCTKIASEILITASL